MKKQIILQDIETDIIYELAQIVLQHFWFFFPAWIGGTRSARSNFIKRALLEQIKKPILIHF